MSTRFDLPDAKIGDTFIQPFRFRNKDTGEPIDQAGQTYRFSLSLNPTLDDEQSDVFEEKLIETGTEAADGNILFSVQASLSATLKPAVYNYELKRVQPGLPEPLVITLLHGKVKFTY